MKVELNKIIRDTLNCNNTEAVHIRKSINKYIKDTDRLIYELEKFGDKEIIKIIKNYGSDFLYSYRHNVRIKNL